MGRIVDVISSIFVPILGPMAGVGILKGLLALVASFGWISTTSTTYQILFAASDALFMLLPVMLASTAGRKFGTNIYTSMTIAAALLYTQLQAVSVIVDGQPAQMTLKAFADAGNEVTFVGIPIVLQNYTSTVLPIIIAVYVQSLLEKRISRLLHESVRNFLTPLFVIAIMVPLTLATLGPIGVWVGNALAQVLSSVYDFSPILAGTLLAASWQIMVIFGVHWGLVPVFINNLAVNGVDPLKAALFPAVLSQAGAAFGVFLRVKDASQKGLSLSATLAGIFDITEPAIYGVTLPRKRPFVIGTVAAAVGGGFIGAFNVKVYGTGVPGILTLPIGIDPTGEQNTIGWLVAGTVLSFALACAGTYFFGVSKTELITPAESTAETQIEKNAGQDLAVSRTSLAPVTGERISLTEVADPVFSSGSMGQGMAFLSTDGRVVAPCDGSMKVVMKTGHAYGIRTSEGIDILIHIGVDTVGLAGEGFSPLVSRGDIVAQGDVLAEVDLDLLSAKGIDPTTMMVITNSDDFDIDLITEGNGPVMTIRTPIDTNRP